MGHVDAAYQMVTCAACGLHYRCTPGRDYYNNTTLEDGVCDSCLLSGHKGADPPDPDSIGPLLQAILDAQEADRG